MFAAILKIEGTLAAKFQDGFARLAEAEAHVQMHAGSFPDSFAIETPDAPAPHWRFGPDNSVTIEPPAAPDPLRRDLTPAGFSWLLAFTDLESVWDALLAQYKTTDRAIYATLKEALNKSTYRLDVTLATVATFRPDISSMISAGTISDIDVSDAAITSAWEATVNRNSI